MSANRPAIAEPVRILASLAASLASALFTVPRAANGIIRTVAPLFATANLH